MEPITSTARVPLSVDAGPWLIAVAASAGGVQALRILLADLPPNLPASVVIVLHRTPRNQDFLAEVLRYKSRMPVLEAQAGQAIEPGRIYIARADLHLIVT